MVQKFIRDYDGVQFSVDEGAKIIKELNDRTVSSDEEFNSITQLAQKIQLNYPVNVIGVNTNATKKQLYVFTSNVTLTLPSEPIAGDWVEVSDLSNTPSPTIARNGENIVGIAQDLVIDKVYAGFRLIYVNEAIGWTIIGQ